MDKIQINKSLAYNLITDQFPEFSDLPITDVEKQGHDNRTYRPGDHMLIHMPTAAYYALKVLEEQRLLPELAKRLSISIPAPIKIGKPSASVEKTSIYRKDFKLARKKHQSATLTDQGKEQLASDLVKFLKEQ